MNGKQLPYFTDDLDITSLKQGVKCSLAYLRKLPAQRQFTIEERCYTREHLIASLTVFLQIVETSSSAAELNRRIRNNFDIIAVSGPSDDTGSSLLVTGYYQPVVEGSLTREFPYIHPLYSPPTTFVGKAGKLSRSSANKVITYPSRREIESRDLAAGYELVWLKDPLDAFFLHVQGSGLIRLRDDRVRGVQYARSNGQAYRSIGKHLVDTGRLDLESVSMQSIRDYLAAHPEELEETLFQNDSFIFFQWKDREQAVGSLNEALTPGRSVAADPHCFPAGGLAFLQASQPVVKDNAVTGRVPLSRFVLVQDQGSAIKGPGRIDLFCGTGEDAGSLAGNMKEKGSIYVLLLKEGVLAKSTLPDRTPAEQSLPAK